MPGGYGAAVRQSLQKTEFLGMEKKNSSFFRIFVDFFGKMRIIINRMDTQKDWKKPGPGSAASEPGEQIVVGAKQLRKALLSGRARSVFLAQNADPAITKPIEALCMENHVRCTWVPAMAELGRACGIDVGAAAAAVVA